MKKNIILLLLNCLSPFYLIAQNIPFHYDHHLYLDVVVNDIDTTQFIFDTGANGMFFDKDYLNSLDIELKSGIESPYNEEVQIPGAGRKLMRVLFAEQLKLNLGDSTYRLQWPFVLPLDSLIGPALGRKFDGIIGYDMLKKEAMSIDYENRMMKILTSKEATRIYGDKDWITFSIIRGKVIIPISIDLPNGSRYESQALIDVGGAHSVIITNQFSTTHDLWNKFDRKISISNPRGGVGGMLKSSFCRIAKLTVGSNSIDSPIVQLSQNKTGAFGSNKYGVNIGNRILNRFTLVFDYTKNKMKFVPNNTFNEPHVFSNSGIIISYRRDPESFKVSQVLEGSSGFEAGVMKGDIIVKINGKARSNYTFPDAQKYIKKGEDGFIKLTIERNGKEVDFEIEAVDLL